jgi:hypothetical protein
VLLMEHIHYEQWFRMEGEFVPGMRRILQRLALEGPVVERLLTTRRNASPAEEMPVYTSEIAGRVRQLYARDFELFGYAEDSWRGL